MAQNIWFSLRVLYERSIYESEASSRTDDVELLFEEKTLVILCENDIEHEIVHKAMHVAREAEEQYENSDGETVRWELREILEIQRIGHALDDGTEVFYRLWDDPDEQDFEYIRRCETPSWWQSEEPLARRIRQRNSRQNEGTGPGQSSE